MKKVILVTIFSITLLAFTGYGVSKSINGNLVLSDLALCNIEAMASGEDDHKFICENPETLRICHTYYEYGVILLGKKVYTHWYV